MTENAQLVNSWFGRTVIYSDKRFSYEEAQHIIETKGDVIPAEISLTGSEYQVPAEIQNATLKLDYLSKILRKRRMKD